MLFIKRFWNNLSKKRKLQLFFLLFFNLINSFCEIFSLSLIFPYLSLLTNPSINISFLNNIDSKFPYLDITEIITLIFIFSIFIALIIRLLNLWLTSFIAARIGSELSIKAYSSYLYQPYEYHLEQKSGEIIASINLYTGQSITAINSFLLIVNSVVIAIISLLTVLIINPFTTLIGLLSIVSLYLGIYFLLNNRLAFISKKNVFLSDQMFNSLQEGIGSIREIKLNSSYIYFIRKYSKVVSNLRVTQANSRFLSLFPKFLIESISIAFIIFLGFILFKRTDNTYSFIPKIGLIVFAIQKLLPYIQQVYNSWANLKTSYEAVKKVLSMAELPFDPLLLKTSNKKYKIKDNIIFENVYFKFNGNEPYIFQNINLTIKKGQKIGIIGETGSGKSTLLDLLMGLIKPSSGRILIDGVDINDPKNFRFLLRWKNSLSAVPQSIFLRDTSIKENIIFTDNQEEAAKSEKLLRVIKASNINQFIKNSRNGLNSLVGERGIKLSGGQLQRIGIARALYKESTIIILDEATSALDNKTESKVIDAICNFEKDMNLIMIAHRISTLKKCDQIVEIGEGSIKKIISAKEFFKNLENK